MVIPPASLSALVIVGREALVPPTARQRHRDSKTPFDVLLSFKTFSSSTARSANRDREFILTAPIPSIPSRQILRRSSVGSSRPGVANTNLRPEDTLPLVVKLPMTLLVLGRPAL